MAENSKIAWTDDTFNPWWGCHRVGPGCDNCYAAALDKRTGGDYWDGDTPPRRTSEQNWNKPHKWNREAQASGIRRKVFCASMADVFDNRVPQEWRDDLWNLIKETSWIDWIIVTKRIGNAKKMLPADWGDGYPNVGLLITIVNQAEANRDVPKLINTPAKLKGLSIEPQLEAIDISMCGSHYTGTGPLYIWKSADGQWRKQFMQPDPEIHWVICGAESGPHRRSFNEGWARSLRDQCQAAGVPFFLKQIPGKGPKGVIETPKLDGKRWTLFPCSQTSPQPTIETPIEKEI